MHCKATLRVSIYSLHTFLATFLHPRQSLLRSPLPLLRYYFPSPCTLSTLPSCTFSLKIVRATTFVLFRVDHVVTSKRCRPRGLSLYMYTSPRGLFPTCISFFLSPLTPNYLPAEQPRAATWVLLTSNQLTPNHSR